MKILLFLISLSCIALSESDNCGCAEKSHSRAAELVGEKKLSFTVLGMSCGSCEADLTKKLEKLKSVIKVEKADHQEKSVILVVKPDACKTSLKEAISKAGYFVKE